MNISAVLQASLMMPSSHSEVLGGFRDLKKMHPTNQFVVPYFLILEDKKKLLSL